MKLLTHRAQVRTAAERWRKLYEQPQGWAVRQDGTSAKDVYDQLVALDVKRATDMDVALIAGVADLVHPHECSECGHETYGCVAFGEQVVCGTCLIEAAHQVFCEAQR